MTVLDEYPARGSKRGVGEPGSRAPSGVIGIEATTIEGKVPESPSVLAAIIAEAQTTDTCSHIVMGNANHGETANLVVGSATGQVVERAHCPVTIIRA